MTVKDMKDTAIKGFKLMMDVTFKKHAKYTIEDNDSQREVTSKFCLMKSPNSHLLYPSLLYGEGMRKTYTNVCIMLCVSKNFLRVLRVDLLIKVPEF